MPKYQSRSEEETRKIAAQLAQQLAQSKKNVILALTGELGAGKTIFVQGFARGLEIKEKIISPTFVLIRQHKIPLTEKTLYHIDLYRLDETSDFKGLGLEELLLNPNNIVLIEWAEKVKKLLPKNTVWISIKEVKENQRVILVKN